MKYSISTSRPDAPAPVYTADIDEERVLRNYIPGVRT